MNVNKVVWSLLAGLVAMAVLPAFGVERVFTNNNASMSVAGSWDPSGVPGAGDTGIIGGGASVVTGLFTAVLSGPPDALVVRSNGVISLSTASMTSQHNIIMEGGALTVSGGNYAFGNTTISLKNESLFYPTITAYATAFTGLIQNAGAEAGRLIITNSMTNLAGYVSLGGISNTYSGGTIVYPGTLRITKSDTLGTGATELRPGSILEWGATTVQRSRILGVGGKHKASSNFGLTCTNSVKGDLEVEMGAVASGTMGGFIEDYSASEAGRLVKTGLGTLTLSSSNNTYSGGTLVAEGVLSVFNVERALGKGNVIVTNGAELRVAGASTAGITDLTWPGWEVSVLSNAMVRLSTSSTLYTTNIIVLNGGMIGNNVSPGNFSIHDRVRIGGRVFFYRPFFVSASGGVVGGVFRDGAVPGHLIFTGSGTGKVQIANVQLYTGGTEIDSADVVAPPVQLTGSGRMPDTGEILVHTNGIMDFNNITDTVGGLAGVGQVSLGKAVVTVNEGVSPGTNNAQAGVLSILATSPVARIVLAASSTNLFHLRTPARQDKVVFQGAGGLTLAGTIKISGPLTPASGTYTLFDLNGGTLLGSIPTLILPDYCTGSVATNSGDVVLTLKAPQRGSLMVVK